MGKAEVLYARSQMHSRYHSPYKRAMYALVLVGSVLISGTILFHYVEGYSYVYAFYFMSMIATAQGPQLVPVTTLGKLLESLYAFISVGSVIFALAFLFGPFLGKLFRMGAEDIEREEHIISKDIKKYEKKL